jgi:RNA polymerase sigma factor (sigma-70 family)
MDAKTPFEELIRRVRAHDEQAAAELVRRYEPAVRIAVRTRLTDAALRRIFDSTDIAQSVLANFFVRAASGQFELQTSEQLIKLLVTMARNKLSNHAVKQRAARRDYRRLEAGSTLAAQVADRGPSPSQVATYRELLKEFRGRLSAEELRIADARSLGRSWEEIAAETGGDANALRSRLSRAISRVVQELELEE